MVFWQGLPTREHLAKDFSDAPKPRMRGAETGGVDFTRLDEPSISQVVYATRRTRSSDGKPVKKVLKVFRRENIYLNSDCDFSTFAERSYDYKPVILAKLR